EAAMSVDDSALIVAGPSCGRQALGPAGMMRFSSTATGVLPEVARKIIEPGFTPARARPTQRERGAAVSLFRWAIALSKNRLSPRRGGRITMKPFPLRDDGDAPAAGRERFRGRSFRQQDRGALLADEKPLHLRSLHEREGDRRIRPGLARSRHP